jgi:hypothetical protein
MTRQWCPLNDLLWEVFSALKQNTPKMFLSEEYWI